MRRQAATRAQSRLAAGANASDGPDDSGNEQAASDAEADEQAARPVLKKQTRRPSVRTTRKGSLSGLLRLPAELITTICQHLDLGTLFHVSRLNKYLWRLLRQTSSLDYVWERARIESGLPELTAAGMNVFQYANLVFGCCQGCGASTSKVEYVLRARHCFACAKTAIWNDKDGSFEGIAWHNLLAPASALTSNGRSATTFKYLVSEIEHTRRHLEDEDDDDPGTTEHKNDCRHVVCATLGDRYTMQALREAWRSHGEQRSEDGAKLIEWQLARGEEHKKELEKIRQRRREAIEAEFVELGWHPHHFEADWWSEHSLVKVAREFSENVWTSIEVPLTTQLELHRDTSDARFLADARTRRRVDIECEYAKLSRDEARQLGIAPKPRWADFEKFPTIQAIIGVSDVQNVYDEPNPTIRDYIDDIVKDLRLVVDQLGTQLGHCLRKTIQELQPRAPPLRGIIGSDTDGSGQQTSPDGVLDLAIAVFDCESKYCGYVDTFPHILSHECYRNLSGQATGLPYGPSETTIANAMKLLKVTSMPYDTKSAELDKLGSTWTCLDHPQARVACTWKEMLQHMTSHCSAQNVVQESLEAAKDRVFALHLADSDR